MPKNKTHKGAAKRFKVSGSGKIRRLSGGKGHNMEQKSAKQARRLSGLSGLAKPQEKRAKKMLGI